MLKHATDNAGRHDEAMPVLGIIYYDNGQSVEKWSFKHVVTFTKISLSIWIAVSYGLN